ncbi:uncharacterized protein [Littorina saxatilis]|uniref:uncharacterized protein isoform X2 n=1 Tax=Littorina saxatilis TaxID=31220 RepID=UPI0038B4FCBB
MTSHQRATGAIPKTPRQGSGPTQQASAPAKEGWLFVPAGTTIFGLVKKRRYCVLEGQSKLVIYKDRTKTKVKAVLHLQQAVNATGTKLRTRMFGTYVFEIRMTGDEPPLVLVSRDKADMLDWIYTLNDAIMFIHGPARHVNCPSQGMTGGAKHQAEDRTDPSTCQQSGLSDAEVGDSFGQWSSLRSITVLCTKVSSIMQSQ